MPEYSDTNKIKLLMMPCRVRGDSEHPLFDHRALYQIRAYLLAFDQIASRTDIQVLPWTPSVSECGVSEWALSDLYHQLRRVSPDVVALSLYTWSIEPCHRLASFLKQMMPRLLVVVGGPEIADREQFAEHYPAFDVLVEGDGELPARRVVERLLSGSTELADIPNVSWRRADGTIAHEAARAECEDPNNIPNFYADGPFAGDTDGRVAYYVGTRGCRRRCSYCLWAKQPLVAKEKERVILELATIAKRPDIDSVYLNDHDLLDVLQHDPETFAGIARALEAGDRKKRVVFSVSPSSLTNPMFQEVLRVFDVDHIYLGLQSVNPDVLKAVDRGWATKHLSELASVPDRLRSFTRVQLVVPMPMETPETFYAGMEHIIGLGFYRLQVFPFQALRGTAVHRRAAELGLKFFERSPYFCYETSTFSNSDWIDACAVAHVFSLLDHSADSHGEDSAAQWQKLSALFRRHDRIVAEVLARVRRHDPLDEIAGDLIAEAGLAEAPLSPPTTLSAAGEPDRDALEQGRDRTTSPVAAEGAGVDELATIVVSERARDQLVAALSAVEVRLVGAAPTDGAGTEFSLESHGTPFRVTFRASPSGHPFYLRVGAWDVSYSDGAPEMRLLHAVIRVLAVALTGAKRAAREG